ncbi:MAG: hypothetical protein CSA65_03000 [Proteobacteria bacterium]|nr:MAG: hypothetical protein CSA65_03000 [Pseudomonadota bacterium]
MTGGIFRGALNLFCAATITLAMSACSKNVGVPGQAAGSAEAASTKSASDPASRLAAAAMKRRRMPPMGKMGKMPPGHPPMHGHGEAKGPTLTWKLPQSWKAVAPATRMRLAQFELAGAAGAKAGSVAVFHFPRQGGSVMGNISRWIRQFKQPADGETAAKPEIVKRRVNGLKVTRVRYSGTYLRSKNPMRMGGAKVEEKDYALLAAIVTTPRGPWFFKGIGPKTTMDAQLKTFDAFLASITLKHPAGAKKPPTGKSEHQAPHANIKIQ